MDEIIEMIGWHDVVRKFFSSKEEAIAFLEHGPSIVSMFRATDYAINRKLYDGFVLVGPIVRVGPQYENVDDRSSDNEHWVWMRTTFNIRKVSA